MGPKQNNMETLWGPFTHSGKYETYMDAAIHVLSFTTSEVLLYHFLLLWFHCYIIKYFHENLCSSVAQKSFNQKMPPSCQA